MRCSHAATTGTLVATSPVFVLAVPRAVRWMHALFAALTLTLTINAMSRARSSAITHIRTDDCSVHDAHATATSRHSQHNRGRVSDQVLWVSVCKTLLAWEHCADRL